MMPSRRSASKERLGEVTTRTAFVVSVLLCATSAVADPCPAVSFTDAKAMTRAQLEERICKYLRTTQAAMASRTTDTTIAVASHCIARAQEVEDLYEERFAGKVSKCMTKGAPELVPPPKKP